MNHTLRCGALTATISEKGGELCSLTRLGKELIWQGDGIHWNAHAPLLFPICGKVKNDRYSWQGKSYPMPIHGFLSGAQMSVVSADETRLSLLLTDSGESRAVYPFSFSLLLDWELSERALSCKATVRAGVDPLPFSFGAHPGFALPYNKEGFSGASLIFDRQSPIRRVELTENGFFTGNFAPYPLADGHSLPLAPDPALGCGLFLEIPADQRAVTLSSPTLTADLRVDFPDFPYLGLWHDGGDFLCIEPWQGLPALDTPDTSLAHKPAALFLAPGEQKRFRFTVTPLAKSRSAATQLL